MNSDQLEILIWEIEQEISNMKRVYGHEKTLRNNPKIDKRINYRRRMNGSKCRYGNGYIHYRKMTNREFRIINKRDMYHALNFPDSREGYILPSNQEWKRNEGYRY